MKRKILLIAYITLPLLVVSALFYSYLTSHPKQYKIQSDIDNSPSLSEIAISDYHPRVFTLKTVKSDYDLFFEGLTKMNPNGEVELALATDLEVSSDQCMYTFTLRPSYWSNGDVLTANDIEESWKEVLNPETPYIPPESFFNILNAKVVSLGHIPVDMVGIWAKDPMTLVVRLEEPNPFFLEQLTHPAYFPMHTSARYQKHPFYENKRYFITNGPYQLSLVEGEFQLNVEKNELFHRLASEWENSNFASLN
jgi:ABC-type oligopeptide transport system substrate-binding subunit